MDNLPKKGNRKMDEKKVREAIKAMENQIAIIQKIPEYLGLKEKTDKQIEERQTAIESLEKQLPKKPDIMDYVLGDINFKCPTCKSEYICEKGYEHFYCPNCGQKIKWSE